MACILLYIIKNLSSLVSNFIAKYLISSIDFKKLLVANDISKYSSLDESPITI